VSELLPRPVRLLLGATSRGVGDRRLREATAGRIVLITGASSGVGRASALRLGAAGATVLLVARREELLETVRDEVQAAGGAAHVYPCDLADLEQVGALAERVLADHGRVDVLVSNAGMSIRRWISETYDRFRDVERTINVNYLGPVRLMLGLLPSMRERGEGQIVSVATVGVSLPPLRWSAYIASKAALETWLAGVAPEVRADGVRTTSIHLQLVRSPMLGPFRMWNYLPGMSSEEAAGIVARAIVERPRTIAPLWGRLAGAATQLAQAPLEPLLAAYATQTNPESRQRRSGPLPLRALSAVAGSAQTIVASGLVRPIRPDRLLRALRAQQRYGATPAGAAAAAAELYRERTAIDDELGTLSFGELDTSVRALAAGMRSELGIGAQDRVGILCRNHRGFVQAAVAATRLGCDLVPFNTDFSGTELADVAAREGVTVVVYDEEFEPVVEAGGAGLVRILAWHEQPERRQTLRSLIAAGRRSAGGRHATAGGRAAGDRAAGDRDPAPDKHGRIVMLTSGTTGTPKGATRTVSPLAIAPVAVAGLLDLGRIRPVARSGDPFVVAPPLFHLYGFVATLAAFAYGSPIVITRRFDPEMTLAQIERTGAGALMAVPTMLKRIMDLSEERRGRYDTSSLRMLLSGAAPLAPELATAVMDEFGDVLYNAYASTEVGTGTLAAPRDLRAAPGTVGRPMAGTVVKILDEHGGELPAGETGRVFVGSPLLFEGYTGGGGKEVIRGLMSTGDVGHFDAVGRLFIDGRDDDMILSGGENVFPQEVEELLSSLVDRLKELIKYKGYQVPPAELEALLLTHPAVADAAVVGVPDQDFGQRLAAFVVLKPGASTSEEELKPYVRERLARFKVPREITIVDELPRNSTGKLQRRKLGELHEAETAR
jgi:acyl-CoA synthetase (AMP-forming)/AMP-acid ligase II/NAD(P)-dependent dehydrogenase (short-subunit alcohol dehydrogenase family)